MKVEWMTDEYVFEHGESPKGYGYWGFTCEGYEFWASGTYTEAKKNVKAQIKKVAPADFKGTVYASVMP